MGGMDLRMVLSLGVTSILMPYHDVHSCTLLSIPAEHRFFPLNALTLDIAVLPPRV